jgi:hypothetical protein
MVVRAKEKECLPLSLCSRAAMKRSVRLHLRIHRERPGTLWSRDALQLAARGRSARALGVPARRRRTARFPLVVWVGCCVIAGAPTGVSACGVSPQAAFSNFIGAFNALDWPSFKGCLADSVSLFGPDIPGAISLHRLDGRSDVERSFRALFDAAASDSPPRGPNIHPENVLFQQFSESATVTFEFRRSDNSFGRRTLVLARVGGLWKIVHIHASNVSLPP